MRDLERGGGAAAGAAAQREGEQVGGDRSDPREVLAPQPRSDNAVKNHYHSKLRKGLRKINAAIALRLHPHKVLKNNILSKIIQAAEESLASGPAPPRPEGALAFGSASLTQTSKTAFCG